MSNFGYVFATKMLIEGKRKVRFMYREKPDESADSGWRFFCGDEDQAYTDTPGNIAIYDINTVLDIDGSVKPYLDADSGAAFEREDDSSAFTAVENFAFGTDL
jgi:hypothetical protein